MEEIVAQRITYCRFVYVEERTFRSSGLLYGACGSRSRSFSGSLQPCICTFDTTHFPDCIFTGIIPDVIPDEYVADASQKELNLGVWPFILHLL